MDSLLKIPFVRALHVRGLLFPAVILLLVAGVLAHGVFYREPAVEAARMNETETAPPSHGGNRPDVEKTLLAYESDFWLQLAQGVRNKISLISSQHVPAVSVSPTLAVASISAAEELIRDRQKRRLLEDRAAQEPAEASGSAEPSKEPGGGTAVSRLGASSGQEDTEQSPRFVAADGRLGLALFEWPAPTEDPFSLINPASLPPGSFLAAITVEADKRLRISPGYLVSAEKTGISESEAESFEVSFDLGDAPATAAVVDLDGNLAGLAVRSSEGTRLLPAPLVSRLVKRLTERAPCYGIEVTDPPASAAKALGLGNGVFVERVLEQSFEPSPSIRPGDVILRWAGKSMESADQFYAIYDAQPPGSLVRYAVRRGGQRIAGGTVIPGRDCRPIGKPPLSLARMGMILEWSERSPEEQEGPAADWRVTVLIEDAPAAESGLQLDDRILSVNGLPLNRRNAERLFSPWEKLDRPLALLVKRGDRLKLLAVSADEVTTH